MSLSQFDKPPRDEACPAQVKALIILIVTTQDMDQLRKLTQVATHLLDEQNVSTIDTLVKNGALMLVTSRLMKALLTVKSPGPSDEVNMLSEVLQCLLRCDSQCTHEFVTQLGCTLISELLYYIQSNGELLPTPDEIHHLLMELARLPWSMLAKKEQEVLLRVLQKTMRASATPRIAVTSIYCLGKMADDAKQKDVLIEHPGLVEDVLHLVASSSFGDRAETSEIVLYSCRFLRRLAWGMSNRGILAKKKNLNKVLFDMAVNNKEARVREEAIRAIWQMSTENNSRRFFIEYKDAALMKQLVRCLEHPTIGMVAVNALSNLVDGNSAKRLASYQGIFDRLSTLAIQGEHLTGVKAAQILRRIAGKVCIRDQGHSDLLDALVKMSSSTRKQVRAWSARGLLAQSESSANAFFFARSQSVLEVVTKLSRDQDLTVRRMAIQTLFNTASEASNTRRAAFTTRYLNAFICEALGYSEAADEEKRNTTRLSIKAILKLSDHPRSYRRVAKQNGAIEALARYGVSSDTDLELKGAALHAVVLLSPFL